MKLYKITTIHSPFTIRSLVIPLGLIKQNFLLLFSIEKLDERTKLCGQQMFYIIHVTKNIILHVSG